MTKQSWKPGTMLAPLPPALISSGTMENPNVMTAAWTGIICSDPVITYVSIRPSRYSHELISQNKEFVINLTTWKLAEAVDTVGVKSGRDCNKFALTGLSVEASTQVGAPQIAECPVSIECKVMEIRPFGTHDMFLAEVVAVNVDEAYINEDGALDLEKAGLLAYAHGFYYTLGRKIGKFGFSVEKKKKAPKIVSEAKEKTEESAKPEKEISRKADKKFGKETKIRKVADERFMENGVEVIMEKRSFKKAPRRERNDDFRERKPRYDSKRKPDFKKRSTAKFGNKGRKATDFSEMSYKRKSDGTFKKRTDRPRERRAFK